MVRQWFGICSFHDLFNGYVIGARDFAHSSVDPDF